jgi:RNA polymerase sigma factor (sigma-70 family)
MNRFKNPALEQLTDQQVRFAPPSRRMQQLARAERLLAEVEPGRKYPYQFVCFRLTGFRATSYPGLLIESDELTNDLCLFIAELARSMPAVPVEKAKEQVLTLSQMSKRLNVSTKTINRWRQRGLIGLPVVCKGRRQVGFFPSLVEPFLSANQDRMDRSSRFSQLSEAEKEEIMSRAKRLSRLGGGNLTEISRRIARRLGRSPETVRYTIKNYDRDYPDKALFPDLTGPLDLETKQVIYSSFRRGISVESLAKRFRRKRNSVYRVINEIRAKRLLERPLDYIYHPSFDDPSAELEMLAPMPGFEEFEAKRRQMSPPKDTPPELTSLYEMPLLNKEQEQHLFRQMNFLKHQANQLRNRLEPARVRIQDLNRIEETEKQAAAIKDQLIGCNLRLVVSIAKRHAAQADNFFELLSDGNMSLLRAVEKFDFSRGNKFSTYATWAIMKNYARSIPEDKRRRERFQTGKEELFDIAPDTRSDEQEMLASAEQKAHQVNRLLEHLDPRERQILRMRAGLDNAEGMTLEEIGQQLGITKERVRQLNVRIINKLRTIVQEQKLEM